MTGWPLHITLADVFAIDGEVKGVDGKLEKLLSQQARLSVTAKEQTVLGTTPVVLIEKNDALVNLHSQIIDLLKSSGAVFNNPEFTRDGFLPHSTIQQSGRLQAGDVIVISEIALIDMFPNDDWQQRKVLSIYKLGSK